MVKRKKRKHNKKYGIQKILKEVVENELKNAEAIMKDEFDNLRNENLQYIAKF